MHPDLPSLIRSLSTLSVERQEKLITSLETGTLSAAEKHELEEAILASILILEDERDTALQLLHSA